MSPAGGWLLLASAFLGAAAPGEAGPGRWPNFSGGRPNSTCEDLRASQASFGSGSREALLCSGAWRHPLPDKIASSRSRPRRSCRIRLLGKEADPFVNMTPSHDFPARTTLTKVFYINLDVSTERREFMEKQLNESGVPYERFPAVHAQQVADGAWNDYYAANNITVCPLLKGKWGAVACPLSHRLVWEKILSEDPHGTGVYLVLEDDTVLPPGWSSSVMEYLQLVPNDWTLVKLGVWGCVPCDTMVNDFVALVTSPAVCHDCKPFSHDADDDGVGCRYWFMGSAANLVSPMSIPTLLSSTRWWNSCQHDVNLLSAGANRNYAIVEKVFDSGNFGSDRLHIKASANVSTTADVIFEAHPAVELLGAAELLGAVELLGAAAADTRRAPAPPEGPRAQWPLAGVALAGMLAAGCAGAARACGARRGYRVVAR